MSALRSWLLEMLPKRRTLFRRLRLSWLWQALVNYVQRSPEPIRIRLHGFDAWLNPGNPYPFVVSDIPSFNRPLVELVASVSRHQGRPLVVIDVGASLGNTALLLLGECGAAVQSLQCVEGDAGFFDLLRRNTEPHPQVTRHHAMLARQAGTARALVHHHPGTAGASGSGSVPATTLDELLLGVAPRYDLLKVDIDGSDGEALAGAAQLLQRDQPAVIFEWHPHLVQQAGHDSYAAFAALRAAGYTAFLWYTNHGEFSHFSTGEPAEADKWRRYLLAMQPHGDPHFDIVALPAALATLELPLASFGIAR